MALYIIYSITLSLLGFMIGYSVRMLVEVKRLKTLIDDFEDKVLSDKDRSTDPVEFDKGAMWVIRKTHSILMRDFKLPHRTF